MLTFFEASLQASQMQHRPNMMMMLMMMKTPKCVHTSVRLRINIQLLVHVYMTLSGIPCKERMEY